MSPRDLFFRAGHSSAAVALLLTSLLPAHALAHLSLIRNEWETQGALEQNAGFGRAVCSGDFDGDGFEDLASAAPNAPNGNPGNGTGSVVVNYGSKYGLTHVAAAVVLFDTSDPNQSFGRALASGDFNDDGFDDLAIGAPRENVFATTDAGKVHIYVGSAGGLINLPALTLEQEDVGESSEAQDLFGWALAVGRFTADSFDDLAVGAVGEDGAAGAVYVFRGTVAGLTPVPVKLQPSSIGESNVAGDQFGFALEAIDVVSGPQDDLAAGAPFRNGATMIPDVGRVYVFPGDLLGLTVAGALAFGADDLGESIIADGRFGWSLAGGRFAGGGAANRLAIGEPGVAESDILGRVHIAPLSPFPPPAGSVETYSAGGVFGGIAQYGATFAFAIAAGDMDGDGDAELAIGEPGAQVESGKTNSGLLYLMFRHGTSLADSTAKLDGWQLLDEVETDWRIGEALAFGRFDQFDLSSLAIGAPGANFRVWKCMEETGVAPVAGAGQVHIFAPWRQAANLLTRTAIVRDCDGEVVFSQRPFDPVAIASTTKTMTVYLAAEAIEANEADRLDEIEVSMWAEDCFKGTNSALIEGEIVNLETLMKMAINNSFGDACIMIAALLSPEGQNAFPPNCNGYEEIHNCGDANNPIIQPWFVNRMNDKASELGMLGTHFTNPHGSTAGSKLGGVRHHSTAWDMSILMQAAMLNPTFREFVSDPAYGTFSSLKSTMDEPLASGAKSGWNTFAHGTLVGAARDPLVNVRDAAGGVFGTDLKVMTKAADTTQRVPALAPLLDIAVAQCGGPQIVYAEVPPPPPPVPVLTLYGASANVGSTATNTAEVEGEVGDFSFVTQVRDQVDASVEVEACAARDHLRFLGPGEEAHFGIDPLDHHDGVRVTNFGRSGVDLVISATHPPINNQFVQLMPHGSWLLPAAVGGGSAPFDLEILNASSIEEAALRIEEIGYCFDLSLGGVGGSNQFTALLTRENTEPDYEMVTATARGVDTTPGNTVTLVLAASDVPTGVVLPGASTSAGESPTIRLLRVWPNPGTHGVQLEFALARATSIDVAVFDVTGRRVATLIDAKPLPEGAHRYDWNGRNESGDAVAAGLYFLRLEAADAAVSHRIVILQ